MTTPIDCAVHIDERRFVRNVAGQPQPPIRADELTAVMQGFIRENAEHEQDQDLYNQKYAEYEEQMNTVDAELQRMRQKKADQIARKELLEGMIREIEENDLTVTEFDEKLWRLMVESVEVDENEL